MRKGISEFDLRSGIDLDIVSKVAVYVVDPIEGRGRNFMKIRSTWFMDGPLWLFCLAKQCFVLLQKLSILVIFFIIHFRYSDNSFTKYLKYIRVALSPKILFKIVIFHNIKRIFPKNLKNYEFSKKLPIWRLLMLTF